MTLALSSPDTRVHSTTLSAVGSGTYLNNLSGNGILVPDTGTQTTAGLSARIPLYQGGLPAARIRQAQAIQGQLQERTIEIERLVVANARSAFATWRAALDSITSNELAVKAAELALEGVRAEQSVGTRTVLDVLDAEQELFAAEVDLVQAQRERVLAGYRLRSALGRLTARDLGLEVAYDDPKSHYDDVSGRWFGLGEPVPAD